MGKERPEPFLKWAGGKRLLLPAILPLLPPVSEQTTYFEPFLGGGAVFFALQPSRGFLSDINAQLIESFLAVRDQVEQVIKRLRTLRNSPDDYYRIRRSKPRSLASRAARFIYLNKTCFNGLYRENLIGEFNVPYGRHGKNLVTCDEAQLRAASKALSEAKLESADFEEAAEHAREGDLVYFDPPYITSHRDNGFAEYNAQVFSWDDQRRLSSVAKRLTRRGVQVAVSNADHSSIQELYTASDFAISRVQRWSTVAGNRNKRIVTTELLICSGESPVRRSLSGG